MEAIELSELSEVGGAEPAAPWIEPGSGTIIDPSARISPLAYIGADCQIGPGVVLEGHVLVANGCTIAADAYLRDTVLSGSVRVGIQAHLVGCYVAPGVTIGRGARLINHLVRRVGSVLPAGSDEEGLTPPAPLAHFGQRGG